MGRAGGRLSAPGACARRFGELQKQLFLREAYDRASLAAIAYTGLQLTAVAFQPSAGFRTQGVWEKARRLMTLACLNLSDSGTHWPTTAALIVSAPMLLAVALPVASATLKMYVHLEPFVKMVRPVAPSPPACAAAPRPPRPPSRCGWRALV